jgi:hypothetical protein
MITRFIAVICDVGNNRFISLLLALVVVAVRTRHGETLMGTHGASFSYGPHRSKVQPLVGSASSYDYYTAALAFRQKPAIPDCLNIHSSALETPTRLILGL